MKPGVKVDVARELMGVVQRGCRHSVMRCVMERVCLDALRCKVEGCECLCVDDCHVFERNGVR